MKLYLLRHGETDWNKKGFFQGQTDIPLNDAGRELAVLTRSNMPEVKFDRVYCSPLCRAVETAEIFLKGRFPLEEIRRDERIKEFSFGNQEGASIEQAKNDTSHPMYNMLWHPELYVPAPGGGESFQQLAARAAGFLRDEILPLEGQCENVLIVAHGALNRSLLVAAGLKEVKDFWSTKYLNCCVTTLDVVGGKVSIVSEAEIYYDPANYATVWAK